jgi:hypothetical protein
VGSTILNTRFARLRLSSALPIATAHHHCRTARVIRL